MKLIATALLLITTQQAPMPTNPYITLMTAARAHEIGRASCRERVWR